MGQCFSGCKGSADISPPPVVALPPPQPRPPLKPILKKSKPTTTIVDCQKKYRLLRILDGDTFDCFPDVDGADTIVRVRIARANAPEIHPNLDDPLHDKHKKCGELVTDYVLELLADKLLTLDPLIKPDKWPGRVDCEVILPDGRNLSNILLDKGLAKIMGLRGHRDPFTVADFDHILKELQ